MTSTFSSASRRRGLVTAPRIQFVRFPIALSMAQLGACFAISALVDLTDDGDTAAAFLAGAVVCGAIGAFELRRVTRPSVTSAPAVMTMATLAFTVLALGGAAAHLLADATDEIDTALLEGTAPITTTAMTGLDADSLPRGLLMFRALLQWMGGLGGLIVALVVIPLVVGGKELRGRGQSDRGERALIHGRTQGVQNVAAIYVAGSILVGIAYLVAGLGVFDSIAHAMATVSTGGLSTRTGSLAAFDDSAVEWVAAVGMAVAGLNLGVVWWVLRGDRRALRRNTELRVYLGVMGLAIVALALWIGDGAASAIRTATLTVTSAMSTTGFTTDAWWNLDAGAQMLLLTLLGVGAMTASAGGGFRYLRAIQAFGFALRELRRQLHPSAVTVVRVNGRAVEERTLERMTGYIVLYVTVVAAGGMLIELGDSGITPSAAISLSVSALSTAGPQVIDPVDLGSVGTITKVTLSALMLLGRLSIYAVLLAVINFVVRSAERVEDQWHRSADR
ncbi:MAG: potassium transporter TrkG [Actinomycetota bacterium]